MSSGGYLAFCAANNAMLVAVNGMKTTIEQQQRVVQSHDERIHSQQRLIEDLRRAVSVANKQLQEQKSVSEYRRQALLKQESRTKYHVERAEVLQKKVNFLLADENRFARKDIRIRGTAIRVEWARKKCLSAARWSRGESALEDGTTTQTEMEANDTLDEPHRKKAPKGKPSFSIDPAGDTDSAADEDQKIAAHQMLKQMYSTEDAPVRFSSSRLAHLMSAATNSNSSSATNKAPVQNTQSLTAKELEYMWGDFASCFGGDVISVASAPSASAAASVAQAIGNTTSAVASVKPLDYSVLQALGSANGMIAPTTKSVTYDAAATSSSAVMSAGNSSAAIDLSETGGHSESPHKKQRLLTPEETALSITTDYTPSHNGHSHTTQSPLRSSPRLTVVPLPIEPAGSSAESNAAHKSAAVGPITSSSTSSNPSSNAHTSSSDHTSAIMNTIIQTTSKNMRPQPWHTAADGPLRERNVDAMLHRHRIRGTQEAGCALPTWVESRREGCRKLEANLYYECATRGEYMYKVLK